MTLLGLTVAKDRSVDYAKVEPEAARRMFVDHALVRGEFRSRGHFQAKNALLLESVARLRDKARVSDMMADDEAIFDFFDRKLPPDAFNGQRFEVWREEAERKDPSLLLLSLADVLVGDDALAAEDYPDLLELHGTKVAATYRFDPRRTTTGSR